MTERSEFIDKWRAGNGFRYGAGVTVPLDEMNARKLLLTDPRRELVVKAHDAKVDRLKAESLATPLRLSPAALRACGISVPVESPPDASVGGW